LSIYERTEQLVGKDKLSKLQNSRVLLFGLGGVGGYTAEALARAGIGSGGKGLFTIVDCDSIDETNINRQIIALSSTIGRRKSDVMAERIKDINPAIHLEAIDSRLDIDSISSYKLEEYDYVIDAIDDVPAKLLLIEECEKAGTKIISSMGTGNKLDPFKFKIADISKTHTCPLARKMRKELKERGISHLTVLFSEEVPNRSIEASSPASISFVPSVAGLEIASYVCKKLTEA